jgi:hypothetical protein
MNQTTAPPSKPRRGPAALRKAASREKSTLLIPTETSIKLSVAAALRGMDRSELVSELLADSLRHIVISVRATSNGSAVPAGDVRPVELAAH